MTTNAENDANAPNLADTTEDTDAPSSDVVDPGPRPPAPVPSTGPADGGINSALTLLPAQRKVLDAIRVPRNSRPLYPSELGDELKSSLGASLAGIEAAPRGLWVSKRSLSGVLGCERNWLASEGSKFEWSASVAGGVLLHKAVELWSHSSMSPEDAVRSAVELSSDPASSLGAYLSSLGAAAMAEAVSVCTSLLTRFCESFPPLLPAWSPTSEMRTRVRLLNGAVVLAGQYDLTLGTPAPAHNGLVRAGRVIIDIKTGSPSEGDLDDLLFYALLESMSVGVPPLGVGSFYVADSSIDFYRVEESDLYSAASRVADGVMTMMSLRADGAEPTVSPGRLCTWCPVASDCEAGQNWLAEPASGS